MSLMLEGKPLGPDEKTLLIAEVSANHDGDLDRALHLVDIAADAGWDCLKLQTYNADSLTMRSDHPSMDVQKSWGRPTLYDLYEWAHMPMEFHRPLFDKARERGLLPFTSIYDPRDLDFIEDLGCAVYKIASFEMTFDDLLRAVGTTGKPVILSTGMATMDEIEHALEVLDKAGSGPVVLLHCCSSYPAPFEQINLRAMALIGERFGRMVGFSDHTIGSRGPLAAAAIGAVAVEKHFTDDPTRDGPDHKFSATPDVMREIAQGVEEIHTLRGSPEKHTTENEVGSKAWGRRSAFALHDLPAGHVVAEEDFRFIRPSAGIPPTDKAALVGARLSTAVRQGHPIRYEDLDR
ncbi:N-acetylneuraminate synthase [Tranquillimonas rosea]|uniref:N-acetylneuraminate synthase n=1 Tax=Tranquillimonas rosea TaxID=641238 RepID=A0A1H9UZD4_9RHOB|nr:N-acetylneuraminate synthase family protein [Tranquillimonas rosea]SES14393.1 N-acetylneuraminate synthase [Tranquillimonas rosea]